MGGCAIEKGMVSCWVPSVGGHLHTHTPPLWGFKLHAKQRIHAQNDSRIASPSLSHGNNIVAQFLPPPSELKTLGWRLLSVWVQGAQVNVVLLL